MVRVRSEEVGDARSVIESIVRAIDPAVHVQLDHEDLSKTAVEVVVKKGDREARCIVTFEVWEAARREPEAFQRAMRTVLADLEKPSALPVYLMTSAGVRTESPEKAPDLLRMIARAAEADVLA